MCLGNICRSPAAEAVFTKRLTDAGLLARVEVDSAGTAGWHIGKKADRRMRDAGRERGYAVTSRARQVTDEDFAGFDRILAMDRDNLEDLSDRCPPEHAGKLALMRSYDSEGRGEDVPDPYYGGEDGFFEVIEILERRCAALLSESEAAGR